MSNSNSIWFRMGYALERAAQSRPRPRLATLDERTPRPHVPRARRGGGTSEEVGPSEMARDLGLALLARAGAPRGRPEVRAGLAGALAAGSVHALRAFLLSQRLEPEALKNDTLRGAAVGMAYGAFVDPWIPGPSWARGTLLGLASYSARSVGGLSGLLGPLSPHRQLPVGASLFEVEAPEPDTLWEHLMFGLTLVAFYRSNRDSNGISNEE